MTIGRYRVDEKLSSRRIYRRLHNCRASPTSKLSITLCVTAQNLFLARSFAVIFLGTRLPRAIIVSSQPSRQRGDAPGCRRRKRTSAPSIFGGCPNSCWGYSGQVKELAAVLAAMRSFRIRCRNRYSERRADGFALLPPAPGAGPRVNESSASGPTGVSEGWVLIGEDVDAPFADPASLSASEMPR
jgi:hypothetical protein